MKELELKRELSAERKRRQDLENRCLSANGNAVMLASALLKIQEEIRHSRLMETMPFKSNNVTGDVWGELQQECGY